SDIYLTLGAAESNYSQARRFKDSNRLDHRVREAGRLTQSHWDAERPRTTRTALEEAVIEKVDENPNMSTRNLAHNLHVNSSLINRALKQEKYYFYHYIKVQALTRDDFSRRVNFCGWLQ
ncbi:hypothetical protein BDFB_007002, partial [Asbolus verrucosus]